MASRSADIGRYPAGKLRLTYRKQTTRLVKCVCATCQYPADIGRYPAGKLRLTYRKQTTRLVKCVCATCQYPARTTRVWLDASGPPHCPEHGAMEEVT